MSTTPARRPSRSGVPTRPQRKRFLEALEAGHSVTRAAELGGRAKQRFYELRATDADFAEQWEVAYSSGIDRLEDALVAAATEGWTETDIVEKGGSVVSRITKHRKRPELLARVREWRRPPIGVEVQVGAPLEVEGQKIVGWEDLFALARETGQEHLLGLRPGSVALPEPETIDAEAEEVTERCELPAASAMTVAEALVPEPDATASPITGDELVEIFREGRDVYGESLFGGTR